MNENRISRLLRHTLVQNALSLYGIQIASYIVPLVTVPYLARVLGAAGWGRVAFAQSFGLYVALVGEYGFGYSATREVARHRGDKEKLKEIVAGVHGAKVLLAISSLLLAVLLRVTVPIFREQPALLWSAMFWALTFGFSMMWFFQGFERMRLIAVFDIGAKILSTLGIFLLVKRPEDAWRVLFIQGAGLLFSFVAGLILTHRIVPLRFPRWGTVQESLRMGWSMFVFRNSVTLYTTGNAFILGLFAPPQIVGFYAGAEKICKALIGLLNPITQTLYPRLSHLAHHAKERAASLAKISFLIMATGGLALGIVIFVSAPLIVRLLFGPGFEPTVPVLRILSLLAPLIALNNAYGLQWLVPLGLDRPFNRIILAAGLINVALASMLATRFGATGMAWSVVAAELLVIVSILFYLRWHGLNPESFGVKARAETIAEDRKNVEYAS